MQNKDSSSIWHTADYDSDAGYCKTATRRKGGCRSSGSEHYPGLFRLSWLRLVDRALLRCSTPEVIQKRGNENERFGGCFENGGVCGGGAIRESKNG